MPSISAASFSGTTVSSLFETWESPKSELTALTSDAEYIEMPIDDYDDERWFLPLSYRSIPCLLSILIISVMLSVSEARSWLWLSWRWFSNEDKLDLSFKKQ